MIETIFSSPDPPRTSTSRIVSILGLFELSVGDQPRADGASELAAARLAVDHVNRRLLLPGYTMQLVANDTKVHPRRQPLLCSLY